MARRLHSLDGLRGIAAVVVMLYHLSLVARPFLDTGRAGDAWWWLTQTPLKIFTAGTEAVLVFFVLSGLVVALPALREGFSTPGYLVSRLVRLYLPVWGSLALACALIALVPRDPASVTDGAWIDRANAQGVAVPKLLGEASLLPVSYDLNNVLWSLRWELIFSLALPLFALVAVAVRRHWLAVVAVSTALMITGRLVETDALVYLPAFLLGTMMAVHLDDLRGWARRRRPVTWGALLAGSCALLIASWLARPVEGSLGADVLWALAALGAAGAVVVALGSPLAQRALSSAVPRWLGRVSFSLYLVQAPVIATLAFGLGDRWWPLVAVLGIPACLLAAWAFWAVVERPSHRLARWVARRVSALSPGSARPDPASLETTDRSADPADARSRLAASAPPRSR